MSGIYEVCVVGTWPASRVIIVLCIKSVCQAKPPITQIFLSFVWAGRLPPTIFSIPRNTTPVSPIFVSSLCAP